jgi:hypothetical protein
MNSRSGSLVDILFSRQGVVAPATGNLGFWTGLVVYYSWMNRKARAEGCKWKGYYCYLLQLEWW